MLGEIIILKRKSRNMTKKYLYVITCLLLLMFAGCTSTDIQLPPSTKEKPEVKITLYSPIPDGLVGQDIKVPASEVSAEKTLERLVIKPELKKGGSVGAFKPFLPPNTKIIDVVIDKNGLAVVNFSREVLNLKADRKMQRYAVTALVKTLEQARNINSVKFQVEGKEKGRLGKKNIEDWWGEVTLKEQPWKINKVR